MSTLPELTIDDFRPRLNRPFQVDTASGPVELLLTQAQELPNSGRSGGSFRLEFQGPAQPMLMQMTYLFHIGRNRCPVFIVPLGPIGNRMRYEAIFY